MGQTAVTRGYYVSIATMLAQQRLEEVKQLQYCCLDPLGNPTVDQFCTPGNPPVCGATPPGFNDEGFGAIPGLPNFSRQVRVQHGVPAANMKTVTVTVSFTLPTQIGSNQEGVAVGTLIAARP